MTSEREFISGIDLSGLFFRQIVEPLLQEHFPQLIYSAALAGDGSEVLGYDDALSTDHDWGPRLHLFIPERNFASVANAIGLRLEQSLPAEFMGQPITFEDRDRENGLDKKRFCYGSPKHGIEIFTPNSFFKKYLQIDVDHPIDPVTWLSLPQQLLLAVTGGKVFRDDDGSLTRIRKNLAYFPQDVWLYLLACQWNRIAQEQVFVSRCGDVGDEIGSAIIAARLVRDLIRLCFLMERRYAPYPKWLGTAFNGLPNCQGLIEPLCAVLAAQSWQAREEALCKACRQAGEIHARLNLPGKITATIEPFHTRPYRVINAGDFVQAVKAEIVSEDLRKLGMMGSIDQISDNVDILSHADIAQKIGIIYGA